jgi:flagellar protein FliO/FliZ
MGLGTVVSSIFAIIIALALVIAMAWGAIWIIKKIQDKQMGVRDDLSPERGMHFIRSMPLGQRERIVLVEVGDRELLLGVTAGSINLLADWPVNGTSAADALSPAVASVSSEDTPPPAKSRKFPAIPFPPRPGKSS